MEIREIQFQEKDYVIRRPQTIEEILESEDLIVKCRLDNLNFLIRGYTYEDLKAEFAKKRDYEI